MTKQQLLESLPNPFDVGDVPDELRGIIIVKVDGEEVDKIFEVKLGADGYSVGYGQGWDEYGNLDIIIYDGNVTVELGEE